MTSKYNSERNANASANTRISDDDAELKANKESLAKLREELGIDDKQIHSDAHTLAAEVAAAEELRTKHDEAQKLDDSLQSQVTAANAKANLASQCAAILASGYEALNKDGASTVTYREIATQYKVAAEPCKGVVNFVKLTP